MSRPTKRRWQGRFRDCRDISCCFHAMRSIEISFAGRQHSAAARRRARFYHSARLAAIASLMPAAFLPPPLLMMHRPMRPPPLVSSWLPLGLPKGLLHDAANATSSMATPAKHHADAMRKPLLHFSFRRGRRDDAIILINIDISLMPNKIARPFRGARCSSPTLRRAGRHFVSRPRTPPNRRGIGGHF